jgi:hypothetical protein
MRSRERNGLSLSGCHSGAGRICRCFACWCAVPETHPRSLLPPLVAALDELDLLRNTIDEMSDRSATGRLSSEAERLEMEAVRLIDQIEAALTTH